MGNNRNFLVVKNKSPFIDYVFSFYRSHPFLVYTTVFFIICASMGTYILLKKNNLRIGIYSTVRNIPYNNTTANNPNAINKPGAGNTSKTPAQNTFFGSLVPGSSSALQNNRGMLPNATPVINGVIPQTGNSNTNSISNGSRVYQPIYYPTPTISPTNTVTPTPTPVPAQVQQSQPISTPTPTPVTQITIVFKSPDGSTQTYTPPVVPPVNITWGRYVNSQDNYSVDYPINWQVFKIIDSGHEGLAIFPPGVDAGNQYSPHIGLGISAYYSIPSSGGGSVYPTSIIINNVPGTLYTNGSQGSSYIASVFRYAGGYLGLASSVTTNDLLYVFSHMIYSLTLQQ